MTKFQVALIGIFSLFIVLGVIAFSQYKGSQTTALPSITIWGTLSSDQFTQFLGTVNTSRADQLSVNYIQYKESTFVQNYIEALASGKGPDAILVPHDIILREQNKLVTIPYTSLDVRTYKSTFIQGAEMFLQNNGSIALPFSIDPLVMYWNRSIFTNEGLATYPTTWDQFTTLAPKITKKDSASNISQSLVALGEFRNNASAKDVLATLIMQAGEPIVTLGQQGYSATLGLSDQRGRNPARDAVNYFMNFANTDQPEYSWNRALPQAKNYFIAGNLATYFGYASELGDIRAKNPNLNFDVAMMPQLKTAADKITYARMYGLAIAKSSTNPAATLQVIGALTDASALSAWTSLSMLPPVRRDLLSVVPADPYLSVLYSSALIARGWLDPDTSATRDIFQNMIESIASNKSSTLQALSDARNQLAALFK